MRSPFVLKPPAIPISEEPARRRLNPTLACPHTLPFLFEIAWEVCWQLGGIYTVLKTKADMMLRKWGDRYCLIGPYNPQTAAVEFEEQPAEGVIAQAVDKMREQGIACSLRPLADRRAGRG